MNSFTSGTDLDGYGSMEPASRDLTTSGMATISWMERRSFSLTSGAIPLGPSSTSQLRSCRCTGMPCALRVVAAGSMPERSVAVSTTTGRSLPASTIGLTVPAMSLSTPSTWPATASLMAGPPPA